MVFRWFFLTVVSCLSISSAAAETPNIVLIYCDDVGYGDVGCYGAKAISTPNIDRIASAGVRFTDGHCASATCTPSRFAMLTGEYAWRKKGTGIAKGDANAIIQPGTETLASVLKKAGYRTGVVGKWHLGLGEGKVDWNTAIKPGPLEIGFDYSFLIPATGDRVPCVYVENHHVVGLDPADPIEVSFDGPVGNDPTGLDHPELLKMKWHHGHNATIVNGISRIGFMSGGHKARWVDEDMADVITSKAVNFVDQHAAASKDQPFFLYFSYHDIHVPRVPHPRFVGKTSLGPRGDAMVQLDWCTGQILDTLEKHGLDKNTMVIFSSDNGPVLNDGYYDDAVEKNGDHKPAGPWRGGKYSNFEGGTRVPFIVSWPGHTAPGTTSDALVCQIDFMASFAELTEQTLGDDAGPDSLNTMDALLGRSATGRDHLVEHARALALRQGHWKLIEPNAGPAKNQNTNTEVGAANGAQLYNLSTDPGETKNLAKDSPQRVQQMLSALNALRRDNRSRPVKQTN
ncbi:MAG: arylsulfatase [Planctomycetaceae bacterium]|nr:arylsulfatase [Planctomycetaceae bacterium]